METDMSTFNKSFTIKVGKGKQKFFQTFDFQATNGPGQDLRIVTKFRDLPMGTYFYFADPSVLLKRIGKRKAITAVPTTKPFRVKGKSLVYPVGVTFETTPGYPTSTEEAVKTRVVVEPASAPQSSLKPDSLKKEKKGRKTDK